MFMCFCILVEFVESVHNLDNINEHTGARCTGQHELSGTTRSNLGFCPKGRPHAELSKSSEAAAASMHIELVVTTIISTMPTSDISIPHGAG